MHSQINNQLKYLEDILFDTWMQLETIEYIIGNAPCAPPLLEKDSDFCQSLFSFVSHLETQQDSDNI